MIFLKEGKISAETRKYKCGPNRDRKSPVLSTGVCMAVVEAARRREHTGYISVCCATEQAWASNTFIYFIYSGVGGSIPV